MNNAFVQQAVLQWIAERWKLCQSKPENILAHLSAACVVRLETLPKFECFLVCECESGTIESGSLSGIIRGWWRVDDSGIEVITFPGFGDPVPQSPFMQRPIIKFYSEADRILIGERFGERLLTRIRGDLVEREGRLKVENVCPIPGWVTFW